MNNLIKIQLVKGLSSPENTFKLCILNVRSSRNKSAVVYDYVCAWSVAVTETWLTKNDSAVIHDVVPTGYKLNHCPRLARRGTALFYKDTLDIRKSSTGANESFEFSVHLVILN